MSATSRPRSSTVLGVLYAEDFGDELSLPVDPASAEPETIEPTFTLAELDAARAEAREEGERHARSDEQARLAHTRAEVLASLAAAVETARSEARHVADAAAESLARTVLAVVHGALPSFSRRHGEGEVRALVRQLLPMLSREPRATVRVNPHTLGGVQQELAADPDLIARITLVPTDALLPGDLHVSWDEGMLTRDSKAIQAAMHQALAELGLIAPATPTMTDARAPAHHEETEYAH